MKGEQSMSMRIDYREVMSRIKDDVDYIAEEAYKRGYDKGYADKTNNDNVCKELAKDIYQRGLNDAWEAARKIVLSPDEGGTSLPDLFAMFGNGSMQSVFRNYSASEAIAKLKAYEEKQKADEDGKAANDKGCEGCEYAGKVVTGLPCISCCNSYKNQWTAKEKK